MLVAAGLAVLVIAVLAGAASFATRRQARRLAELEAHVDQSHQLVSAMEAFLSGTAAVELTTLRGWARTLKRRDLDLPADVASDWAARIESGIDRLGSGLADLALLAGLDRNLVELRRHPTDVAAVIATTLEQEGVASAVTVTVPPDLEPPLVDPHHLARIVAALVRGAPLPVEIGCSHCHDRFVLTVAHAPRAEDDAIPRRLVEGLARLHGGTLSTATTLDGRTTHEVVLPNWPESQEGSRVLVVDWQQDCKWVEELGRPSYDVATCGGLDTAGAADTCPIIEHGRCPLVESADLFVFNVRGDDTKAIAVLREYRRRAPSTPLVIAVPTESLDRYEEMFPGCVVVPGPLDSGRAADLVSGSLRLRPSP